MCHQGQPELIMTLLDAMVSAQTSAGIGGWNGQGNGVPMYLSSLVSNSISLSLAFFRSTVQIFTLIVRNYPHIIYTFWISNLHTYLCILTHTSVHLLRFHAKKNLPNQKRKECKRAEPIAAKPNFGLCGRDADKVVCTSQR